MKDSKDGKFSKKEDYKKSKRGGHGKQNYDRKFKERSAGDVKDERDNIQPCANDASWYATNQYLLNDSAALAFANAAGVPVDVADFDTATEFGGNTKFNVPGIATIGFVPTVGKGGYDSTTPINVAARSIYSWVRYANAGHANYDTPDLMMYLLAMDSIYAAYAWMARLYGCTRLFAQKNRFLPQSLIESMNVDYNDILNHLADFRYYLNVTAEKASSMAVPASMSYFARHIWMCSNVFVDAQVEKAQLYLYNPDYLYRWDMGDVSTQGTRLIAEPFGADTKLTFASIKAHVDSMLAAVLLDEDANIMSGDIIKAFGTNNLIKVNRVPEDYVIGLGYSEEVLSQIQNATLCGEVVPSTVTVTQLNDIITTGLKFETTTRGSSIGRLLNMYKDIVSPADTMVATRLAVVGTESVEGGKYYFSPSATGSEVATKMTLWEVKNGATHALRAFNSWEADSVGCATIALLNVFSCHPLITLLHPTSDGKNQLSGIVGNLDNFTVVDSYALFKMHETALLSEFSVPQIAAGMKK